MTTKIAITPELEQLCIDTVRTLSMDAVQQANSGHPGTPMALAPLAWVIYARHLRYHAAAPDWPDRDRFVLSAGHASMLLYSVLHLAGYDVSLEQVKAFRQWGSLTPGHPEHGLTPGVETTTGPLGQGLATAVGMAMAEAHLAAEFNTPDERIVDHYTYFVASDGDIMEGISHEAASLAGHLRLGKLIGCYDENHITIEGSTDLAYTDDAAQRFAAYGWHVQRVADVNDLGALDQAIEAARAVTDRPSLIVVRSHIGWGSPNKQDTAGAHGEPLGKDEIALTKQNLGWQWPEPFHVPPEALAAWRAAGARGATLQAEWQERFASYASHHPELAREFQRRLGRELPHGWRDLLPTFPADPKGMATRIASSKVLNAIAPALPELMGGSADLAPSTKTLIEKEPSFAAGDYRARNLHFGIREHAMGAALNGMALHGGIIPYGATFLIFADYMRPAVRLAALMEQHVIYVWTHDSIGLGEDGPTHQPIEQLAALRAIPGLTMWRPADANETAEAWAAALQHRSGPVGLALTRQNVPVLDRTVYASAAGVTRGGYVLSDPPAGQAIEALLLGSGSEVHILLEAQRLLAANGVSARVVSMPSLEVFAAQPQAYRDAVLPPGLPVRVALEAGSPLSWWRLVGTGGAVIGIDRFGASAPYQRVYQEFGLTAEHVARRAQELLGR
ncbi:MAG: transketolase [Gemmatimonadetes bacterium]|nr:transketolase [Gemmatimonadota bacterium]